VESLLKKLLPIPLILIAAAAWWVWHKKNEAPQIPFAKVKRETLISTLPTNGKVEPIEWQTVRSESEGLVEKVPVQEGQFIAKGALVAQLSQSGLAASLAAAEARVAQAQAELATLEAGGRSAELVDIENSLAKARFDREAAMRDYNALRRLADKQAATLMDVQQAQGRLREADLQIEGLNKRRAALVSKSDKTVAVAKLHDAQAAVAQVRTRIAQTEIHAPLGGMVYALKVRPGAFVNPGDEIANIGQLDRVRVRVYVDEPELGRVFVGQPVTITWTARPGQRWNGSVEKGATDISSVGTRQVGEVLCTIDNAGHELVPGTNVDAEIRTSVVEKAISIPREALRREAAGLGVYALDGDEIHWRPVQTGTSSITRVAITQGLQEGDAVALPTEEALKDGEKVKPVLR
jgi:HlyD family secretion protein